MNEKIYLFDFDGTLVDSMDTWAGVYIDLLKENGIEYPEDIVKIITPLGNVGACEYCISLGLKMNVSEIEHHNHKRLNEAYSFDIPLKSDVFETLGNLKDAGCSLNVLTASPHRYLDPCLKRNGIYDMFSNVWSIDDFGLKKNDVRIYEEAAKRLNAEVYECVFADDNFVAVETAGKAGMKTIGVYDKSSDEFKDQIKAVCDKYIYNFSEII